MPDNVNNVVNSFNDWDPLQEIIVGTMRGACVPPLHPTVQACSDPTNWPFFQKNGGNPFPKNMIEAAESELNHFCKLLKAEGVTVHRPEPIDFSKVFKTPDWESPGLYAAMPRDILTVIGDEIIEAPMAWPSRYFEYRAYRPLMNYYLDKGCQWTIAPKGTMSDVLYRHDYLIQTIEDRHEMADCDYFVTTESEICFDAADIMRVGKDIFIQRSQVTNNKAISWLKNHLKGRYRVKPIKFKDPNPMHIDATFVPLAPGLILANPERPCYDLDCFKEAGWDIIDAPEPTLPYDWPLYLSSRWLSMNILLLDNNKVFVEENEQPTIKLLKKLGFKVITLPFRHVYSFGGSFHCVTCDVRRDSSLVDYKLILESDSS